MAHRQPYAWLGIGAVTVGVGAALAGGAGAAYADTGDARAQGISSHAGDSPKSPRKATAATRIHTKASPGDSRLPAAGITRHSSALPQSKPANKLLTRRAASRPARPAATFVATAATAATPTLKPTATVASNPVASLLAAVSSLFGLNTPTPPVNPLTGLLWGLFRGLNNALGFTPQAGVPTIGTPDPNTGTVTGTWHFTEPAGLDMTYLFTGAANGEVHVYTNGTYSYTPTEAVRLTATASTTDSFAIVADDGIASTSMTITLPVLPIDKPVAGTPAVGTPDSATGAVTGSLNFTDPAGKPLTYTVTGKPTQGSVTVNADGGYTYTPTSAARQAAGSSGTIVTDSFTVAAANDLASTDTTVTVPVSPIYPAPGTVVSTVADLGDFPQYVKLSPDGSRLYIGTESSGDYVVSTANNTVIGPLVSSGGTSGPAQLTISPDGSRIYALREAHLAVIDAAANTLIGTVPVPAFDAGSVISADGSHVYVVGDAYVATDARTEGVVTVFTTATSTTSTLTFPLVATDDFAPLTSVAISPDSQHLYVVSSYTRTVYAIDLAAGTVATLPIAGGPGGYFGPGQLAVSPDGDKLYIPGAGSLPNPLSTFDTTTNSITRTVSLDDRPAYPIVPSQVQVSADGSRVYVLNSGLMGLGIFGSISVIDATSNDILETLSYDGYPESFAVTADGHFAYVAGLAVRSAQTYTVSKIAL